MQLLTIQFYMIFSFYWNQICFYYISRFSEFCCFINHYRSVFFLKRMKIYRVHLFKKFYNITAVIYEESNRFFIKRLLIIHVEYICLEYEIFNFILFDKLLNSLTKSWFSFVNDCVNHAVKNDNIRSFENSFLDLYNDILLHLLLDDKNDNSTINYIKNHKNIKKGKNKKNKNIKKYIHCEKNNYKKTYCWIKHSEQMFERFYKKFIHIITEKINSMIENIF